MRIAVGHSGVDTETARPLKQRILAAPAARAAGFEVWLNKDNLDAGQMWQRQLGAIDPSTAFAVPVGSRGVVNWVEAEVRLALSRAMVEPSYLFVPLLAGDSPGAESLPSFLYVLKGFVLLFSGSFFKQDWKSYPATVESTRRHELTIEFHISHCPYRNARSHLADGMIVLIVRLAIPDRLNLIIAVIEFPVLHLVLREISCLLQELYRLFHNAY